MIRVVARDSGLLMSRLQIQAFSGLRSPATASPAQCVSERIVKPEAVSLFHLRVTQARYLSQSDRWPETFLLAPRQVDHSYVPLPLKEIFRHFFGVIMTWEPFLLSSSQYIGCLHRQPKGDVTSPKRGPQC